MICLKGARGTGKTTLIRQHVKETFGEGSTKALYVSLDDLWFSRHAVREAVEFLYDRGFTHVFLDEIHHFGKDWPLLVKNLCDQFPNMNFVYSGSSLLQLERAKADLSRRQAVYLLKGMSFREFLAFESVGSFRVYGLDEILANHTEIESEICRDIKVLSYFDRYIESGFYPFYKDVHAQYRERLLEVVAKVLEVDYPEIEDVSQETIRKTKRMLMVLSESCPQTPNMSKLYAELETDRVQGLKMLSALDRAGLLALAPAKGASLKNLSKPEKIYCDNTNLMYALVPRVDAGVRRETYFYNQLRKDHTVTCSDAGDFVVDGKYTFEVGGKGKTFRQIKDMPNSFVVNDGVEMGFGNKIPLWLFGFLY